MTITVIIPTYKRPNDLKRCLEALRKQSRLAEEIIVVARESDDETRVFFDQIKADPANLRLVDVSVPGQVAALNEGLKNARGEMIAFTDDDAIPHVDWLQKIEERVKADASTGGVGGKDCLYINGRLLTGKKKMVGKVQWFGRMVGNHHLGFGNPREVDTLKGANMSFRREALEGLQFDTRLRGEGAQVRNDTALCLAVKKRGWKLIYDPAIKIDHYLAERYEENRRGNFSWRAVEDGAFNETLVLMKHLSPLGRVAYILYFLLIGNIFTPGVLQCIRILPREKSSAVLRLFASYKGRWQGAMAWRKAHRA